MTRELEGKVLADKGYISKELFAKLWRRGLHLITGIRRQHEELSHAAARQTVAAQALHHRDAVRQDEIANGARTHQAPLPNQRLRSHPVVSRSLHARQNKGQHEGRSMTKPLIQNSGILVGPAPPTKAIAFHLIRRGSGRLPPNPLPGKACE